MRPEASIKRPVTECGAAAGGAREAHLHAASGRVRKGAPSRVRRGLHRGSGLAAARLELALALEAAHGGRVGLQALGIDGLAAADADAVVAVGEPVERALDLADLVHVARDLRQVDVGDEVPPGLVAR